MEITDRYDIAYAMTPEERELSDRYEAMIVAIRARIYAPPPPTPPTEEQLERMRNRMLALGSLFRGVYSQPVEVQPSRVTLAAAQKENG